MIAAMESYACQPYTIPAGSHLLQVFVAKRGQLTALATLGTSDIAMTRQLQAGVIRPDETECSRLVPLLPAGSATSAAPGSLCRQQLNLFCPAIHRSLFLLHAGRQGIGIMPHRSALTGRVLSTPQSALPGGAIDGPPWACAVTVHEAGREAALSPLPMQAPPLNQPSVFWPGNSPRPPAPPIPPRVREHKHSEVSGKELNASQSLPPPAPASEDLPPWHDAARACPQALAAKAMQAIHQLNALNVENGPGPAEPADLTHALESDQNFPEPTPSGVLPLRAAAGAVVGEPPDPQGFHPAIDYQALLDCLLPQLRAAESAGAHVLLLVTDSRCFLSIPHFPFFVRHLVARMQWEGPHKEKWFPILVNTQAAGMAAVHFTWAGPEVYDLTHRPLLLSSSGNASHALLLLPQAAQVWARALSPRWKDVACLRL